jgi:purine-binding chemotaxis protein CheW
MQSSGPWAYTEPVAATATGAVAGGPGETWVLFVVDEQIYALEIGEVERIVRAVEVKPLPEPPPHVLGIVNVQGRVLPVIDLRLRFGHPTRDIRLEDHFIVARTPGISVILPVDAALGSVEVSDGSAPRGQGAGGRCLRKVAPLDVGLVYALDLERVVFADQSPGDSDLASIIAGLQMT